MSSPTTSGQWLAQVERQAKRIRSQIRSMTLYVQQAGGSDAEIERVCSPYFRSLEQLYREGYPIACAIETSDLLVRLDGFALEESSPRVSLISSVFTNVRRRIGGVAYAISGLVEAAQKSREVDLELTAFASGSLYLGFALARPETEEDGAGLLGDDDPLYQATKKAIHTIGVLSQKLTSGADESEILREIPDPLLRDTALDAVQGLAPGPRSRYRSMMITGKDFPSKEFSTLTPDLRRNVRELLKKPLDSEEFGQFTGVVREIDLDIQRFELRRLEGTTLQELRCIYTDEILPNPQEYVDKQVMVSGRVQRDSHGRIRLVQVTNIATGGIPAQQPRLLIY